MNSRGFTLIEVVVVMVLIAVSGALIYLNVGRSSGQKQEKLFAQEMVGLIKKARRTSITLSRPIVFGISSTDRFCWIDGIETRLEIPEKILIQGEGIAHIDDDIKGIYFYPDGSSSGGEFTLYAGGQPFFGFRIDILTGLITPG